jgi:hypothetical protein
MLALFMDNFANNNAIFVTKFPRVARLVWIVRAEPPLPSIPNQPFYHQLTLIVYRKDGTVLRRFLFSIYHYCIPVVETWLHAAITYFDGK